MARKAHSIQEHYSLKAARLVLEKLKRLYDPAHTEWTLGAFSNGREQGYCLHCPGLVAFCFAQHRKSDMIVIYPIIDGHLDFQTHLPTTEIPWGKALIVAPVHAPLILARLIHRADAIAAAKAAHGAAVTLGDEVLTYFFYTQQTANDYDHLNPLSRAIVDGADKIIRSHPWQNAKPKTPRR